MTEQLEDAANKYAENIDPNSTGKQMIDAYKAFKAGAHWALERQWIDVKDRLPEARTDVLVFSKREWDDDSPIIKGHYDEKYSCWFSSELHEDEDIYITHWMPLPEKPKQSVR
jgi:hypothetical protein